MATQYDVSAVPFEGFESFNRAGRRWGTTPTTVTVNDVQLSDAEKENKTEAEQQALLRSKLGPDEISTAQYEALRADKRIRIYESSSAEGQRQKRMADLQAEMAAAANEPTPPPDDRTQRATTTTTSRGGRQMATPQGTGPQGGTGPTGG